MSFSPTVRGPLAFASTLVLGVGVLVGAGPAGASLPGLGNVLSTSDGGTSIRFYFNPGWPASYEHDDPVRHASWSPDGSVAAYVDPRGGIATLRFTGEGYFPRFLPAGNALRESPTWQGDGANLYWAQKPAGEPWQIRTAPSTAFSGDRQVTPDDGSHYRNPDAGPDHRVVFQRQADDGTGQPTGPSSVVLYDPAKPAAERITEVDPYGSNPAFSPDGTKVAFIRAGQIVVSDLSGASERAVTRNSYVYDNPTWSPDGQTIAANMDGIGVVTAAADGSQYAAPPLVARDNGVPAYQPRRYDRVVRLTGETRFSTAAAVSQSHWRTAADASDQRERAGAVVLSRSDTFADALGGSALAAAKRGPLLMTPPTSLDADTRTELLRVLAPGGTVYLLGSPGAISTGVESAVQALGFTVKRLAGADRFGTSVAIAKEIDPTPAKVLLATGMDFPDALAAGAAAGSLNRSGGTGSAVVLLTNDDVLPTATRNFLDTLPAQERTIYGVGRFAAQAATGYDPGAERLIGPDRYGTAYRVAEAFFAGPTHVGLATGVDWPDALAGGALVGALGGPLMLTPGTATDLDDAAAQTLIGASGSVREVLVFGSPAVVHERQRARAGQLVSGPIGYVTVINATDVRATSAVRP
ncbi:WD40-like Beta Propeller Repeat [Micromonospora pallida]|uniref:WD40-like Beta Propeller Repeat n=1 Tax=Micromonospora pallida TaxID=145854 RepID=A0A1C6T9K8_9ACTN|nr:cell wall-binding repeat-containing protein [Micromonospora pallida]SCL38486.1 WD40-like Beta Propeller Repeat [Micromonospora pallida]